MRSMSVRDPFDAVYEFGKPKVYDKSCLQFLEPQIRETLCRIDGIVRTGLALNDNEIVNKDVDAKRMFGIAQVMSLVDDWTRRFKLSLVAAGLKLIGESTLPQAPSPRTSDALC